MSAKDYSDLSAEEITALYQDQLCDCCWPPVKSKEIANALIATGKIQWSQLVFDDEATARWPIYAPGTTGIDAVVQDPDAPVALLNFLFEELFQRGYPALLSILANDTRVLFDQSDVERRPAVSDDDFPVQQVLIDSGRVSETPVNRVSLKVNNYRRPIERDEWENGFTR